MSAVRGSVPEPRARRWTPLLDLARYDRARHADRCGAATRWRELARASVPVAGRAAARADAADRADRRRAGRDPLAPGVVGSLVDPVAAARRRSREHGLAFWGWDRDQWLHTVARREPQRTASG